MGTDTKTEIRLAGFGGQGIVLAGQVLGKAAALFEHLNAVFTQSYGPEARGRRLQRRCGPFPGGDSLSPGDPPGDPGPHVRGGQEYLR